MYTRAITGCEEYTACPSFVTEEWQIYYRKSFRWHYEHYESCL